MTESIEVSMADSEIRTHQLMAKAGQYGIEWDSFAYEILYNAAVETKSVEGLVCEIGLRMGFGTFVMMHAALDSGQPNRKFVAVDPFGDILYVTANMAPHHSDYTNSMRSRCLKALYNWTYDSQMNLNFLCMTNDQYFQRFADGVPFYEGEEQIISKYSIAFLDGPKSDVITAHEIDFFGPRMSIGGRIIIDDIGHRWLNEPALEAHAAKYNLELDERTRTMHKWSFIKKA